MKKIAIVRRNGLGDLMCTFPLILYLREREPTAEITLFVDVRNQHLLPYLPPVDRIVVFPKNGNKYLRFFQMARRYRHEFDLAISAKTSPMKLMNLFLYWLKARERIAYVHVSWDRLLINRPITFNPSLARQEHQALKALRLVAPHLDAVPESLYPKIHLPKGLEEKYSDNELPQQVILISATTSNPASRLSPDRYGEILNTLYAQIRFTVLIVGQTEDALRVQSLVEKIRTPVKVCFPRNFEEFLVVLNRADLYFVGDGGVAHIGAGLGKRQVVLYGGVDPTNWRPLGRNIKTLFHPEHVEQISTEEILKNLQGFFCHEDVF